MRDSTRELRARHESLAELVDRSRQPGAAGTARRLVQVYNGGMIPTTPDKFYLTHPVELDGTETEGNAASATADRDQTIPVVVLGSAAMAGDQLIAHAIGGRWVAELRKSGTPFVVCGTCDIPQENLTMTVTGTGTFAGFGGTYPFVLGAGPLTWETATNRYGFGTMAYYFWDFGCLGGVLTARYYSSLSGTPGTFTLAYSTNPLDGPPVTQMTQVSLTCGSGFNYEVHTCAGGNCAIGEWVWTITV